MNDHDLIELLSSMLAKMAQAETADEKITVIRALEKVQQHFLSRGWTAPLNELTTAIEATAEQLHPEDFKRLLEES